MPNKDVKHNPVYPYTAEQGINGCIANDTHLSTLDDYDNCLMSGTGIFPMLFPRLIDFIQTLW